MKKILLFLFLITSPILLGQVPISQTEKLAVTCKFWGYMKYYHPTVAGGKINWDQQLFEALPKIEKARTQEEFSLLLEKWVDTLGIVPVNKPKTTVTNVEYFTKNLNLSWTKKNDLLSKTLLKKLQFIAENKFQGTNYYVVLKDSEVPLEFTNEVAYPEFQWTNKNLRILALFRYWNYVEYFFPYKYQMDQKWDDALMELLPRIYNPDSEKDFILAIRELSIKLNDTHASTFNMKMLEYFGGEKYIAASARIIDEKAIIVHLANDSLAKIDDIKIGDIITKINGRTISETLKELEKYIEGSNKSATLPASGWVMFNGNTDDLEIEYSRDNVVGVKKIHRYSNNQIKRTPLNIPKWKLLDHNIGYVNMGKLEIEDVKAMMTEFKNTQAIIFDDRMRPKYTHRLINDYLNPEPRNFSRFIVQDLTFPGRYIWSKEQDKCGIINPDYYKGKVIVLVGAATLSHGEYTAMSFQTAPNNTIIGSQTAGADGANYSFTLINGFDTSFTCQGVFYPNKKETQRIGIVVDIEIKPTILGVQQGKDEVLDRAILYINNGK
ncbi:MAG: S41 family peptidase [Flavobacterium sp.]